MSVSKAQQKAVNKYNLKSYDNVQIRVAKGDRDKIKAYAESQGKSLNGYINDLIKADMSRHTDGMP